MRRLLVVAAAAGAGALAYERCVKPWHTRWGATDDEVALPLLGDEHVVEPAEQITRAITIDAPPEDVWPWVVQLGADRGGFYSYDWLENLFRLGIHSADEIVDAWQQLEVGDVVAADRKRSGGWYVVELAAPEVLCLQVADLRSGRVTRRDQGARWEFLWTFALRRADDGRTRLLVRERVAYGHPLARLLLAPVGFVSFVMTRRMMLGIQHRAETHRATVPTRTAPAVAAGSPRVIGKPS